MLKRYEVDPKSFTENDMSDLAYWVGVAQSDGHFKTENCPSHRATRYFVQVCIVTSLPMLEKFRQISQRVLKRTNAFYKYEKT